MRTVEVGEVRAVNTNAAGAVEPPSQTETVWEGLVASDGRANAARRLPVAREAPAPWPAVAYVSPFALSGHARGARAPQRAGER
jgi:hypothetical protein